MAIPKSAIVTATKAVGDDAQWLALELDEPLDFVGGQYIIVDSGLIRPNGKAAKRAYSPLTTDAEQRRIELLVKRIPEGLTSHFMHRVQPGDTLTFSGPWGKFVAPEVDSGETMVLATDTGVTAALGLLHSQRFAPLLPGTLFVWLRVNDNDFVTDEFVRQRVPSACREFRSHAFPPIHHPERLPMARALLTQIFAKVAVRHARLCGDGTINYGLTEDFAARGVRVSRDDVESFFNMPLKSV